MEIVRIVIIAVILKNSSNKKRNDSNKVHTTSSPVKTLEIPKSFSRARASSGPASAQTLAAHPCPVARGRDFKNQKGVVLKVLVKKGPLGIHLLKRGS